jgi:uncharacterized Zn finger protein (UPF0148 family)
MTLVDSNVVCSDCGTPLPVPDGDVNSPCPNCGSDRRTGKLAGATGLKFTATAAWSASNSNDVQDRVRRLGEQVGNIEKAAESGGVTEAHDAIKSALEAIHELVDDLGHGEWTQANWTPDELGLWTALIGARNAAHHKDSSIATFHSGRKRDDRLVWSIDETKIRRLRYKDQQREYLTRLAGQPVLPGMRRILALL